MVGSRTVWLVLATCSLACAVGWEANPTNHYHLKIPPSFTSDQAQMITDAATEWQKRSGNYVTFDADPRARFDVITFEGGDAFEMSRNFDGALGESIFDGQSTTIVIYDGLDATTFHQTVMHEIGHAIGLVHTGPGTIMCKDTGCATHEVTCADVQQLEGASSACVN